MSVYSLQHDAPREDIGVALLEENRDEGSRRERGREWRGGTEGGKSLKKGDGRRAKGTEGLEDEGMKAGKGGKTGVMTNLLSDRT